MSLNWSVEDVKDYEAVCKIVVPEGIPDQGVAPGESIWNPVTTALVWASLSTGINKITEENAAEVYARVNLTERMDGPLLVRAEVDGVRPKGEDAFITPDEVLDHVGLWTNATPKARAKFLKGFEVNLNHAVRHAVRRAERVAAQ